MTINFANNILNGKSKFLSDYRSSKTRICVTVGMMTTGYDCEDLLNLALMRPVFSPTDFVQIKGRGTRKYTFKHPSGKTDSDKEKLNFKFFDFFGNFEYFEEKFNYDEILDLPLENNNSSNNQDVVNKDDLMLEIFDPDAIHKLMEVSISNEGMKIDRKMFEKAKEIVINDAEISDAVNNEQWERAISIFRYKYENKPELYLTLEKIRKNEGLDRRITWHEFLERVFGLIDKFKTKDEKLDEEVKKFVSIFKPENKYIPLIDSYIKSYVTDEEFRQIINKRQFAKLQFYPGLTMNEFEKLEPWKEEMPTYIKDYISINEYIL